MGTSLLARFCIAFVEILRIDIIVSLIDEFNEPFETRFEKKAVLCNTIGALLVMLINLIFQNKGKIQYTN